MFTKCLNPKVVRNKSTGELISVPCGKCDACKSLKSLRWVNRIELENIGHKYAHFITLTYNDASLPLITEVDAEISDFDYKSHGLLKVYGGIPYASTRDFQLFIKNLRNQLVKDYDSEKIRYYAISEFGSTTLRPHFHVLLWHDSDAVAQNIELLVSSSWVSYDKNNTAQSRGIVDVKSVSSGSARYVAAYTQSSSYLPSAIKLYGKEPKSFCSRNPPIGHNVLDRAQVAQLFFGQFVDILVTNKQDKTQSFVPLWSSLCNWLFPKCYKFSKLTPSDISRMLGLCFSVPPKYRSDFKTFFDYVRRCVASYRFSAFTYEYADVLATRRQTDCFEQFILDYFTTISKFQTELYWETERLKRSFYLSKHVIQILRYLGISFSVYLQHYMEHFKQMDYLQLKKQIAFEEDLSKRGLLKQYPLVVDSLLIHNMRKLPTSVYEDLLMSFGFSSFETEYPLYVFEKTSDYLTAKNLYKKIAHDSEKNKLKNDWLIAHPEFNCLYGL